MESSRAATVHKRTVLSCPPTQFPQQRLSFLVCGVGWSRSEKAADVNIRDKRHFPVQSGAGRFSPCKVWNRLLGTQRAWHGSFRVGFLFLLQGTSQARDLTQVSCIVDRHFTI